MLAREFCSLPSHTLAIFVRLPCTALSLAVDNHHALAVHLWV